MRPGHEFPTTFRTLSHNASAPMQTSIPRTSGWTLFPRMGLGLWETMDIPTHGRVNFVSQAEATPNNVLYGTLSRASRRFLLLCHMRPFFERDFFGGK